MMNTCHSNKNNHVAPTFYCISVYIERQLPIMCRRDNYRIVVSSMHKSYMLVSRFFIAPRCLFSTIYTNVERETHGHHDDSRFLAMANAV